MTGVAFRPGLGSNDGVEAVRLMAEDSVGARLDWPLAAPDTERVAVDIAMAVAAALVACGTVAFRADEPIAGARWAPPPRIGPLARTARLVGRALGVPAPDRAGVVVSDSAAIAASLFDFAGWTAADQRALVFAPGSGETVIAAACDVDDWRGLRLPPGVRLLLGPGHDGDFAGIAAADADWLERFRQALARDV